MTTGGRDSLREGGRAGASARGGTDSASPMGDASRLSPRARFAVWAVAVGAWLAVSQARWLVIGGEPKLEYAVAGAQLAALGLILWLLTTTPPDAIKLPVAASEMLIAAGAGAAALAASGDTRAFAVAIPAYLVARLCRAEFIGPVTPWWTVLFLWHPTLSYLLGQVLGTEPFVSLAAGAMLPLMIARLASVVSMARWRWAAFGVGAAATLLALLTAPGF